MSAPTAEEQFEDRCLSHARHYCMQCLNANRAAELVQLRKEAEAHAAEVAALQAELAGEKEKHLATARALDAMRKSLEREAMQFSGDRSWCCLCRTELLGLIVREEFIHPHNPNCVLAVKP